MAPRETEPPTGHGRATLEGIHPRTYRTRTHVIFEADAEIVYRIDLRRLQSHADVLRVVQWLSWQQGVTARSLASFIRVATNAAGLGLGD